MLWKWNANIRVNWIFTHFGRSMKNIPNDSNWFFKREFRRFNGIFQLIHFYVWHTPGNQFVFFLFDLKTNRNCHRSGSFSWCLVDIVCPKMKNEAEPSGWVHVFSTFMEKWRYTTVAILSLRVFLLSILFNKWIWFFAVFHIGLPWIWTYRSGKHTILSRIIVLTILL